MIIQDVDGFVSSSEQILRNLALHHLLINGSSAVNGCRQNDESKKLHVCRKESIIKLFNFKLSLLTKIPTKQKKWGKSIICLELFLLVNSA